ncbi:MAG: DUF1836 domain-containing protein [Paludibacteraceae bacterium]|nr:DUF1836 domain-containing protein [Paludibacteraceae bacterium]
MDNHTYIASQLAQEAISKSCLTGLALAACIKLSYVSSILLTDGNAVSEIITKFHCSKKTAEKAIKEATELGLISYTGRGNIRAGKLYKKEEYITTSENKKYGKRKSVNVLVVTGDRDTVSIQNIKRQIENALVIKFISYYSRKESSVNQSTFAKSDNNTPTDVYTNRLTLEFLGKKLNMTRQNALNRIKALAEAGLIAIKRINARVLCDVRFADKVKEYGKFISRGLVVASQRNTYAIACVAALKVARNKIINYWERNISTSKKNANKCRYIDLTVPQSGVTMSRLGLLNSIYD